jgi:hypothetical protein
MLSRRGDPRTAAYGLLAALIRRRLPPQVERAS